MTKRRTRRTQAPSIHISGNENIVGDNNIHTHTEINTTPNRMPASTDYETLSAQLHDLLARVDTLELEARDRAKLKTQLNEAKAMAESHDAPKQTLVDKLTATERLLKALTGTAKATATLLPFARDFAQVIVQARVLLGIP